VNAAVYRDQLRELEADLQAGTLAPDQHEKARQEIEARLAADLGKAKLARNHRGTRGAALALGLAVPICALAVYCRWERRDAHAQAEKAPVRMG